MLVRFPEEKGQVHHKGLTVNQKITLSPDDGKGGLEVVEVRGREPWQLGTQNHKLGYSQTLSKVC